MQILLLHDAVAADAPPEAQDTLQQVTAVSAALKQLGHSIATFAVSDDFAALITRLREAPPTLVFNLVESIAGYDAAAVAVPALLDGLGVAYTGTRCANMALANDKCAAKTLLEQLHLPTPEWMNEAQPSHPFRADKYIVKARFEHASRGLEDDAIIQCDSAERALQSIRARSAALGRPCFAERFIHGREFNLSILAGRAGPQVLAPAEIDFSAFPAGKAHMVGYRAKWMETSFEYNNTPRRFDFAAADAPLLAELNALARRTFSQLGLGGYARVDFRVDGDGPWILEVNANPCIAPDAGFAAALAHTGLRYEDAIARIIDAASTHIHA